MNTILGGSSFKAFTNEVKAITDPKTIKYPHAHHADGAGFIWGSWIIKEVSNNAIPPENCWIVELISGEAWTLFRFW